MAYKSILSKIGVCQARIEGRERQREELERLKKVVRPETYKRVSRTIREAIRTNKTEQRKVIAIIEKHPHELQREILFYKWMQGRTLPEIAELLNYSDGHIIREHGKAIKEINEKYPPY